MIKSVTIGSCVSSFPRRHSTPSTYRCHSAVWYTVVAFRRLVLRLGRYSAVALTHFCLTPPAAQRPIYAQVAGPVFLNFLWVALGPALSKRIRLGLINVLRDQTVGVVLIGFFRFGERVNYISGENASTLRHLIRARLFRQVHH